MKQKLNHFKQCAYRVVCLLLFLGLGNFVHAQVSGAITDGGNGDPLIGATILVKGTSTGTVTDLEGNYSIDASEGDVLVVSFTGYTSQEVTVGTQTIVNIVLEESASTLSEIVVTGYATERKADIIGSVGVVNTEDALTTPTANIAQQLQGRAAGVTVSGDGAPGEGAKVRIRGFTSFGNSNPLYIIDGVPTKDPSTVNPADIESIQVLKDATAASIYGARAAQGVIIITTKGGEAGKVKLTYDGYYGISRVPERSYLDDVLNTAEYLEYLQLTNAPDFIHPVFGQMSSASIPDRIVSSPTFKGGVAANDPRADVSNYDISDFGSAYQIMETSPGTNWFDEILRDAPIQNHQLGISGGSEKATYSASFNYFDQVGTFEKTDFHRYAVRLNTSFKPTEWLRIGENVQLINQRNNGSRGRGEGGPWGWAYRYVPYIPVFDLGGGFGGNSVGQSGNASNPLAVLTRDADDFNRTWRIFGNTFAEIEPIQGLTIRSSLGIDFSNTFNEDYNYKTYEDSENRSITAFGTNNNNNLTWTWTNTATFEKKFGVHSFKLLAGTEAIQFNGYGLGVTTNTFDFEDPNFINLNTDQFPTPSAFSYAPIEENIFSVFGRFDYIFDDRYLFNATVRRDGTSKIAKDVRFGVFPSFGLGWRVSEEAFMDGVDWIYDLKFRGGWGQMGSIDNVNAGNQFTLFGANIGNSFYDIGRSQTTARVGYTPYRSGSLTTVWEVSETTNVGMDASFLGGKLNLTVDVFQNNTNDLLVNRVPTGIEPQVFQPAINLGQMVNRGFDISLNNRNTFGDFSYDATLIFSRYSNEVTTIDGKDETFLSRNGNRISDIVRTQAGRPVSSFWGYEIDPNDRFFDDQSEIDALAQDGAVVGSWKYVDQNGDGVIDSDDQTWLGSPHPDFITSLNLDLRYKNFDFTIFLMWNQGNELFNNVKYFTDLRVFVGGVSSRVLNDRWIQGADNSGATHPRLGTGNENGYTSFTTGNSSSFFIEDGSFLRGRTMQLGYNFDQDLLSKIGFSSARIYLQAQNFFTITNYSGSDPDISIQGGSDLLMGVDQGGFPSLAQYLIGVNFSL